MLFSLLYRYRSICQYPLEVFFDILQRFYRVVNSVVELPTMTFLGSKNSQSVDCKDDNFVSHNVYLSSSVVVMSLLYRYRHSTQYPISLNIELYYIYFIC